MARIIAVNRKYLTLVVGVAVIFFAGMAAMGLWQVSDLNVSKTVNPELKMVDLTLTPTSFTQDLTYGSLTIKGAQVIPSNTFDLTATLQNMTGNRMTAIPVELEITLLGDSSQKNIIPGQIAAIESGQSARVTFKGVKAIGDAAGQDPAAGQHQVTLRIKPNAAGGINQATEANFRFVVDSAAKASAQ